MTKEAAKTVTSHGGLALPKIGLGTYNLRGIAGVEAVAAAIGAGYRLIDSAFNYENEGATGEAVRTSSVPRDQLIYTSKLPGRHHAYEEAVYTIEESLARTGLDYIDLYLIHWPLPKVDRYVEAWRALIDARERGLVKWIGVSNFLPEHIDRLEKETGIVPEVNQVQCHPYFPNSDQVAFNRSKGIITEAWSPLGRARTLLEEPVIVDVAADHDATPAQVVLAWHMNRGVVPIPKSSSLERQASNLEAVNLHLSDLEVEAITALGEGLEGEGRSSHAGRVLDLDPATHEEF